MALESGQPSQRWRLLRDATAFQLKLALDGFRDLLLIPISLVAALLSLLTGGGPHSVFYEVVRLGSRTERWINLFGIVRQESAGRDEGIDALVQRFEYLVVEQYSRGGITATAKDRIDQVLDRLERAAGRSSSDNESC